MAVAEEADVERRTMSQESLVLLDHRLKQLENERLPHRLQSAEQTISQVQAEVKSITEISRGIGYKLDVAVRDIGIKQSAEFQTLRESQIKFMAFIRAVMWGAAAIGALISAGPILGKVFAAVAGG